MFEALPGRGFTRYVEPCAGAFAMPLVAHAAGWKSDVMETSDTSLFSSVVGAMLAGTPYEDLQMTLDGELLQVPGRYDRVDQAAWLLWAQLLARTQARPMTVEYWRQLVHDLIAREDDHVKAIAKKLHSYDDRIGGLSYEPLDMWSHMERVMDDPHTIVSVNPPTYKNGFEKFFDTKGRLTWAEPSYKIFDPYPDIPRLVDMFEGKAALLLCQQQRDPGDSAHKAPVFARHLSLGQYVYLNSNRPEEVFEITGGPKVATRKSAPDTIPLDIPLIPHDHEVTEESTAQIVPVAPNVADFYRGIWMHRLNAAPGAMNGMMIIDGYAAGVFGFSLDAMANPYAEKWSRYATMRFAFGAPHETLRLTRLATMIALNKGTIDKYRNAKISRLLIVCEGVITVEMTRHPEAKGLRGLMKLVDRQKHPDGFKLVYAAPFTNTTNDEVLRTFIQKEQAWQKASSKK